jgi:hypothetical protein
MIVYFNVAPGAHHGRIEKEGEGPCKGINVSITVEEARACWNKPGTIKDCNLAFRRLATEHDFDVAACLKWYRDDADREQDAAAARWEEKTESANR